MPGFDAYHKWMGIPPEDQPADHYRLLGLVRFESDRDVIDASVNKQMSYLRICAKGEHGDLAEEILNQVSQARLCLLDARQKRVYDARLRGSASAAPQTLTANRSIETETVPGADRLSRENAASASDSVPGRNRATASFSLSDTGVRSPDRKSRPFRRDRSDGLQTRLRQPFVWIAAVCLLVAVVTASLLSSPSSEDPSPGLADAGDTTGDGGTATEPKKVRNTAGSQGPAAIVAHGENVPAADTGRKHMTPDQPASDDFSVNSIGMRFVPILPGTFTMGEEKVDVFGTFLGPVHKVTLTQSFHLGQHEVTQEQYEKVMRKNPSNFKGPQNPVEQVSWYDAVEFCRKLSELPAEKAAGYEYRLPTESEWEYACRAGTTTSYSFGDSAAELAEYAWYDKNSGNTTHSVGQKKPNGWGLYDMHGNMFEWCQDWDGNYPSSSTTDPTGAASGSDRVLRGGSWGLHFDRCRSAYRLRDSPDSRNYHLGFRVFRSSIK
jgi:formylglycine-generating enzyme required for sulfatase activity